MQERGRRRRAQGVSPPGASNPTVMYPGMALAGSPGLLATASPLLFSPLQGALPGTPLRALEGRKEGRKLILNQRP